MILVYSELRIEVILPIIWLEDSQDKVHRTRRAMIFHPYNERPTDLLS